MDDTAGAARTLAIGIALLILPTSQALAQTPPTAADIAAVDWRVLTGYNWSSLRDVARTGRPLDASPVSWYGRGFRVEVERTRSSVSRMHRLGAGFAMAGSFDYRSPLQTVARPASEHQRVFNGRYEYRRYLLRDLGVAGLDVGVGGRATGERASLGRSIATNITAHESVLAGGVGIVAAARVRRWSKFRADVEWANGLRIARLRNNHSEIPDQAASGGGGLTMDFAATADVFLTNTARLSIRYSRESVAQYSSHRAVFATGGTLAAGVAYAK